ncbi:MAG: hypothetical protein Q4B34_02590 [Candidatus Saccharibacteria bacterium]|nr:hypothetical protein [Candidatus Saccharibacteria bacterium]
MEEQEVRKVKKKKKMDWMGSVGLTLLGVAVVLLIWFFLNGETKTTGGEGEIVRNSSLICSVEGVSYPIFTVDESTGKKLETRVIFNDDEVSAISLIQTLYYTDLATAEKSESHNHSAMNKSFARAGLEADALSASYSAFEDKMIMKLYAEGSELNDVSMKYFLAEGLNRESTIEDFTKVYNEQGLSCHITE